MFCVVGLGNPGSRYARTRHNVGFQAVDLCREKLGASSWQSSSNCESAKLELADQQLLLLKPKLYMNCSGEAIAEPIRFYKIKIENVIVLHDELDLAPGLIKIKQGGGAAGNKGVQDIIREFGQNFIRIRIGIGHPRDEALDMDVSDWVLSIPKPEHQALISEAVSRCPEVITSLIQFGLKETQQKFHSLVKN